ncbi:hypothetical protein [Halorubrum trueperi]|uniref:Uncharacterized protein n=1 Tax=Halorubrum trueperi TaxID=2004704 RepID=A0ABD5UHB3_9EURY
MATSFTRNRRYGEDRRTDVAASQTGIERLRAVAVTGGVSVREADPRW